MATIRSYFSETTESESSEYSASGAVSTSIVSGEVELNQVPRKSKDASPMQPVVSFYPKHCTSSRVKHYRYSVLILICFMVRSFQASWFSKFKWLEYSVEELR